MDIKQLEAFVYVVENGSFSKAGEQLYLTQPTISAHIASLERELNIKLIVRSTKETYPSEAGKLLYSYAKEILASRKAAIDAVESFSKEMRGTITIASSTVPGQYFLPRLLQAFNGKYPDIRFDIKMADSYEVVEQIVSHKVEIGFTGTKTSNPKCVFSDFAEDRLVVITPNNQKFAPFRHGKIPVRQLLYEPFISREKGSGTRNETETFLREMGISPSDLNIAVEVRSTEGIKEMVSAGIGIAVVSRSACEDYCRFNKILMFDFDNVSLKRKLYLVKHKSGILSPLAQAFHDFSRTFYQSGNWQYPVREGKCVPATV